MYENDATTLGDWIREEVESARTIGVSARGTAVRQVQEWLNLHGYPLPVERDYER